MSKIKKRNLILVFSLIILGLLAVFSSQTAGGAIDGLTICANLIVPSLFPLTVMALFIFNSGAYTALVNVVGLDFTVWLLSAIGGYPCGAILLERLYKMGGIDKKRGEKMLCFCVNAGPSFIVYTIGKTLLHNTFFGVLLLIIHLLPSFVFMLVSALSQKENCQKFGNLLPISDAFVLSVKGGLEGALSLTASVTFVFAVTGMLKTVLPIAVISKTLGFFEITYGIKSNPQNLYLTAFLLGFSGISVIFQILSAQSYLKPSFYTVLAARLLHGVASFLLSVVAFSIFKPDISTLQGGIKAAQYPLSTTLTIIICAILFLVCLNPNNSNFARRSKNVKINL